jgi:predicted transposase YbfD/YdcC
MKTPYKLKKTVIEHFQSMADIRQEKKVKHKLVDIIVIIVCAVVSGAENAAEISMYARTFSEWLKTILVLPGGIPSHDTIERVLRWLDAKEFQKRFIGWARDVAVLTDGEVVAIDGKTVRGTKDGEKGPIHIVSAWARSNGIVLGQVKTERKSNEITAIPELLNLLEIKGCIVTIDAMGCQTDIAEKIVGKEADYVLALKGNQQNTYEDVKLFFQDSLEDKASDTDIKYYRDINKDHGRIEIREYWITEDIDWLKNKGKWPGLKSIGMNKCTREVAGKRTVDFRFNLCSISADALNYAKSARGHWGIENSLHWVLDVVLKDDQTRIRKDNAPEIISSVKRVAFNLMKQDKNTKLSMRKKYLLATWDQNYARFLIFGDLQLSFK